MTEADIDASLRICLISYRSNPHCGGQGVYLKNLSRALKDLGHHVEVVSGPPDPQLDADIPVHQLPCLDLYNPDALFRVPDFKELLDPVNIMEWAGVSTLGFPEPFTFGLRAYRFLQDRFHQFDIIHDNQSLSYGIWYMGRFVPTTATIHHPITVDRDIAVSSVTALWKKIKHLRWYSFINMQKRVARTFSKIITVSEFAGRDIGKEFDIPFSRFRVAPNGINTDLFKPLPGISRESGRIMVTNSADMPLKGLYHMLHAVKKAAAVRPVHLTVIGTPKKNGGVERLVRDLGIGSLITFTGRLDNDAFIRQYARASAAVVPSIYEGFGLPVGEAMACGVPVISTTGGALPEVAGNAAMLVPPGDADALALAICDLLDHPEKAAALGQAGYKRVMKHFTWKAAALKTVAAYQEVIRDYHRF